MSTGRFKAIDTIRRRSRFEPVAVQAAERLRGDPGEAETLDENVEDDRLRLIFTCCHPALPPDARVSSEHALALSRQEPERRFLERRLAELG